MAAEPARAAAFAQYAGDDPATDLQRGTPPAGVHSCATQSTRIALSRSNSLALCPAAAADGFGVASDSNVWLPPPALLQAQ